MGRLVVWWSIGQSVGTCYPASTVSLDLSNQEEEGNSARGQHFLLSANHPKTWMSQSSFELVELVCLLCVCLVVGIVDCFAPTAYCLQSIDKHCSCFAFVQSL